MAGSSHQPVNRMERTIIVSHELTILIGRPAGEINPPKRSIGITIDLTAEHICFIPRATAAKCIAKAETPAFVALLLDERVLHRLKSRFPRELVGQTMRLPIDLQPIASAALGCRIEGHPGDLYCTAKVVEMMCEIARRIETGELSPHNSGKAISQEDAMRVLRAREYIEQRWRDPITVSSVAAYCGINRDKLARGFRGFYDCSVAEAITERRLVEASRMLVSSDLPVGTVGYRSGYLSNTSFSRAFTRRFGVAPGSYRSQNRKVGK